MSEYKELYLILGDQLNSQHSFFQEVDERTLFCMMELRSETDYVQHHSQKLLGFFAAMRHFSVSLEKNGHRIRYWKIGDADNQHDFVQNLSRLLDEYPSIQKIHYQEPDEYRLDAYFKQNLSTLGVDIEMHGSEHFLSSRDDLATFFNGKKTFLMESFYRHMRKKWNILMDGDQPLGGQWNYDASNRKKLPKNLKIPEALCFTHNLSYLLKEINEAEVKHFGHPNETSFYWPINREESLKLLDYFCDYLLPRFGDYQDAMTAGEWSLFHSRLSFALNIKMIHPLEVIERIEREWSLRKNEIDISQAEGFIRQILGWREYVRGIYWAKMPEYARQNYFNHNEELPSWFWTGETKMACLKDAITQSLDKAYAHHIQRLMITGNFALLIGANPDAVDTWYLGIYIDAIEWVEMPNARGMSQFADGGIMATKPYVSSANYIHKMSDYCSNCIYDPKKRVGDKACPFNSLYWDFFDRHEDKLRKNPRIGMAYRHLDKMNSEDKEAILHQAQWIKENIETL
jgi:deoxyribodipyrimidine photolyase-related protein